MPSFLSTAFNRRPGRRARTEKITLLLTGELLNPLDVFCAKQGGISRAAAIQMLIRDGLLQADVFSGEPPTEAMAASAEREKVAA